MLEFSNIPGLTKIFNKDDWKKVFHACAELPNYRESKYSSYFVTNDAETRSGKLYYAQNESEKGGITYDPVSHTALTHANDFGAGKPYEFGKYIMCASADEDFTEITTTGSTETFESDYFYSKVSPYFGIDTQTKCTVTASTKFANGVRYAWDNGDGFIKECTASTVSSWDERTFKVNDTIASIASGKDVYILTSNKLIRTDNASLCAKTSLYYLTEQVACTDGDTDKFLDGVRYAWTNSAGEFKECTDHTANDWENHKCMLGSKISVLTSEGSGRAIYALPTYLSAKNATVIYRYPTTGASKRFESSLTYKRKLPQYSYSEPSDTATVDFELTTDKYYRANRYYYTYDGTTYTKLTPTTGAKITGTVYVTKRYFTKNTKYTLVSVNEYFDTSTTYWMYTGTDIVKATNGTEYTAGSTVPVNSFYKTADGTGATLYIEVAESVKYDAYVAKSKLKDKSWYLRGSRNTDTPYIFCTPIGATAAGTFIDYSFLRNNGNHLYYKDESTEFNLINETTGVLSTVTYLTEGAKTWPFQITDATDLYFKRSHVYYTNSSAAIDIITGDYDLEENVVTLTAGTDYTIGASIASWKASHTGQNIYQHLTNFYLPATGFVGKITHGSEYYERAGSNFPYEGFVAVATETGSEQARGALYRCKRKTYELTEDNHHHYTGDYSTSTADETSKIYYEYNSSTGEYTARGGDYGKVYRNYDGKSFNQKTMDYTFQAGTIYFKKEACTEADKLTAGEDYTEGGNIAEWVAESPDTRTTPYVTGRRFYYRNGWTFTPITGNRYGVTTDTRFVKGKSYYWYSGNNYEFSLVSTSDGMSTKAVIDDTIFGYHNESNDIFWGYTSLVDGTDYVSGTTTFADWFGSHTSITTLYTTKNIYEKSEDTSFKLTKGDWSQLISKGSLDTKYYKLVGSVYTSLKIEYNAVSGKYILDDIEITKNTTTTIADPKYKGWYEATSTIIDTDTPITGATTGTFTANTVYAYRNVAHVPNDTTAATDVTTNLYRYITQKQKIEEDLDDNPVTITIPKSTIGTAISYNVYTRYLDTCTAMPTYYYISDISNIKWDKKFSTFAVDDYTYKVIADTEVTATKPSTTKFPYYYYYQDSTYKVLVVAKDANLDTALSTATGGKTRTECPISIKTGSFSYIGRSVKSQSTIIYIDPTEAINVEFNNLGTMITEVPICTPYNVTSGYNDRGSNNYGNGEEIPTSPSIYLESKNGEEILPDEYYEEVYGSYYWDQFFLDHSISANPIEEVNAYYLEGSYLYLKWKDPTIMIPSSGVDDEGNRIIDADSPPDGWARTSVVVTDAEGNNPVTVYAELTCNQYCDEFLRLDMSAEAEVGTTARQIYENIITSRGLVQLTAISQTGTYTTYTIKPSKIVWTHSEKQYITLKNRVALPDVTYYDYDTYTKSGEFVELTEVFPYYTTVNVNQAKGVCCRFSRDFPVYTKASTAETSQLTPIVIGATVTEGAIIPFTDGTDYYTSYYAVPEITWTELTQLGFFDKLCSSGYKDVTESGVTKHSETEVNNRMFSAGTEISIPWYDSTDARTGKGYAKIMDTNSVIPARDVEMGYRVVAPTEAYDSTKTYYTRRNVSQTTCFSEKGVSGDTFDYEPWIVDSDNYTILRNNKSDNCKLYVHVTTFPHHQYFLKQTEAYKLSTDELAKSKTYYIRTGGQYIDDDVGTISTYLHPFVYTAVPDVVVGTDQPASRGWYEKTSDSSYSSYEEVDLNDPNWIMTLKDPRNRSLFLKHLEGYYEQVPNKEYSVTFRFKICLKDAMAFDADGVAHGHLWGELQDNGTYKVGTETHESDIRNYLNTSADWGFTPSDDWVKFYNEAVHEVINPVIVNRYDDSGAPFEGGYIKVTGIYQSGVQYYRLVGSTYRPLFEGVSKDYTIGSTITGDNVYVYYDRVINSQTLDKFWLPSLSQLSITQAPHELIASTVLIPNEGSPLYYYRMKVNSNGNVYKFLQTANATGAYVNWWCRTALQYELGKNAEEDLWSSGPYINTSGNIANASCDTEYYVFPCFTIA